MYWLELLPTGLVKTKSFFKNFLLRLLSVLSPLSRLLTLYFLVQTRHKNCHLKTRVINGFLFKFPPIGCTIPLSMELGNISANFRGIFPNVIIHGNFKALIEYHVFFSTVPNLVVNYAAPCRSYGISTRIWKVFRVKQFTLLCARNLERYIRKYVCFVVNYLELGADRQIIEWICFPQMSLGYITCSLWEL